MEETLLGHRRAESTRFPQPETLSDPARRTFVCEVCRYGISIGNGALPRCPMCGAASWGEDVRPRPNPDPFANRL